MLALHEVGRRDCHVVAKVVETELVVRTECDVCHVGLAALRRVGTVLVDTVDRESVEHIERAHPLRVALCEVVVDGYDVNAVAGKSVEEYRECRHESLTLTGSHLRNLALVQYDTAEELYVVVNHFPLQVVAACCPVVVIDSLVAVDGYEVVLRVGSELAVEVGSCYYGLLVLCEAACCVLNDAESYRHHFVECLLVDFEHFLLQLVDSVEDAFALVDRCVLNLSLELGNLGLLLVGRVLNVLLQFFGACAQFVVAQRLDLWICFLHFIYEWLDKLHVL